MSGSADNKVKPPVIDPDRLVTFIGELRLLGFNVGTRQYIDAQNLLLALAARGLLPREPQGLCTMLAPLLCNSPAEQETFYRTFDRWFPREKPPPKPDEPGRKGREVRPVTFLRAVGESLYRRWPPMRVLFVAAVLLVGLAALSYVAAGWLSTETGVPTPGPTPAEVPSSGAGFSYVAVALLLLGALLFVGWLLKKSYRRLQLEKWRSARNPQLDQLIVKRPAAQPFHGADFRYVIQQMRRHRRSGATGLDVPKTIDATVNKGGWFTPVYSSQYALPEYLILIDRVSYRDQQARLESELVGRLREHNVPVEVYYFQGDPRVCQKEEAKAQRLSLQDLAALHPDHYLLILSDGAGLLNRLTGRPQRWLDLLSHWRGRALLTPEPTSEWGYREWALAGLDMFVLPASVDGMTALIDAIHLETAPEPPGGRAAGPFPDLLRERKERWLDSPEPESAVVDKLSSQLKDYLGKEGYYWLSACAIYPALHWNLTLYFGYELTSRERFEERLLALVRLPWFRHGSMPDWLRLRLLADVPEEGERLIRRKLEELLISSLEEPQAGFSLPFSPPTGGPRRGGWARVRGRLADFNARRKRGGLLVSVFKTEPEDSPLRDHVFLTFVSGRNPGKLAVPLPEDLSRLLLSSRRHGGLAVGAWGLFRGLLSAGTPSSLRGATREASLRPLGTPEHESPLTAAAYRRRPALIGAVVGGVLSSIPIVSMLNTLCCAWVFFGAVLASYLYAKRSPALLSSRDGARLGVRVGLITSAIYTFIGMPVTLYLYPSTGSEPLTWNDPYLLFIILLAGAIYGGLFLAFSVAGAVIATPFFSKRWHPEATWQSEKPWRKEFITLDLNSPD